MPKTNYKRLTRERTPRQFTVAAVSRGSLWLGDDHLLFVERSGVTETYKRFYFRDIQAITIHITTAHFIWNWILGGIAGLVSVLFLVTLATGGWRVGPAVAYGIILAIFGLPLLLNNVFGATCACQIRTAVQTEDLASLSRLRRAHKMLAQIRPLIAAAQGELSGEEVAARMQAALRSENPTATAAADAPAPAAPSAVPPVMS